MNTSFRRVYLETPYAGDVARNVSFARACAADCLRRGEAPFAAHLLYTQPGVLRDEIPEERERGIAAGLAFLPICEASVAYIDLGMTEGMRRGIEEAERLGIPVERRLLALAADWQIDYHAGYDPSLSLSDRERRDLIAALDDSVDSAAGVPHRSAIAARWRALREKLALRP